MKTPNRSVWRPITTAPKNGTPILVCGPYLSVSIVEWMGEWWGITGTSMSGEIEPLRGDTPTHWMPVPNKPASYQEPAKATITVVQSVRSRDGW